MSRVFAALGVTELVFRPAAVVSGGGTVGECRSLSGIGGKCTVKTGGAGAGLGMVSSFGNAGFSTRSVDCVSKVGAGFGARSAVSCVGREVLTGVDGVQCAPAMGNLGNLGNLGNVVCAGVEQCGPGPVISPGAPGVCGNRFSTAVRVVRTTR